MPADMERPYRDLETSQSLLRDIYAEWRSQFRFGSFTYQEVDESIAAMLVRIQNANLHPLISIPAIDQLMMTRTRLSEFTVDGMISSESFEDPQINTGVSVSRRCCRCNRTIADYEETFTPMVGHRTSQTGLVLCVDCHIKE